MKVSEIRVGNFILFPVTMDNGVIIPCVERKVDIIEIEKVISLNPPTEQSNFEARLVHCGGIELTENWLIKFGFTKLGDKFKHSYYMFIEEWYIRAKIKYEPTLFSLVMYGNYVKHIKYVHELQNLFYSLTETELEHADKL